MRGPGEARLVASGALLQQIAQASGLVALLVIVTLLARDLEVAELGAYGLVASLAGYLLVLRNSVASAAVRAMASAAEGEERASVFVVAQRLYALVGTATGLLIAGVAVLIAGLVLDGSLASDARTGGVGLGVVTAVGIMASIQLDRLRAERMFAAAAGAEIAAVAIYLVLMVTLILANVSLSVIIALSGLLPLLSGAISGVIVRRRGLAIRPAGGRDPRHTAAIVPTAGWLLVIELSNLAMYASGRIILGAYRTPRAVGLYEGPVRAHNLLYALAGALAVPTVPTASRYAATGDDRRLRELAVRGSRYTLALFVPLCVTLMVMSKPVVGVWLGERYADGATALSILVSYWLVYGALIVTPGFLTGAGAAPTAGRTLACAAAINLVLALILTPKLGVEGPAVATAGAFAVVFPVLLRTGLRASGASLEELARRAMAPAYALGALLAGILAAIRFGLEPETLAPVAATAILGVLAYWAAYYGLVLDPGERELVRGLLRR
ncbi:MAG TPA: oligosaccharide flippase family protein [Thermoleophilaceae bacterium]|nr:oligosaccharide flippase family protein [Thermoleophilaceae bacterium]